MNNKTIEKAVRNTIEAANIGSKIFEAVREIVQSALETEIDARRDDGKKHDDAFIDSDVIMEDLNINFNLSYAPDDAKNPDIRELLKTLADYLEESHKEELKHKHYGDKPLRDGSACSYCRAIAQARALLK